MKAGSLEDVYRHHMNEIYRYLLQLSSHPQIAEDLVQDTFIKAYEFLESYQGEKVRPWLFRVAHNAYIDWYRKEKRQVQTDPQVLAKLNKDFDLGPEEHYLKQEQINKWFEVINSLPEKSRQVILLRDYYDFTYEDISKILNINISNVKTTLFRARQKVREVMKDEL
ncbi:hypothetical protein SYNTR_1641 [Candidatus Syntrophocurvum alkaliphilum]|uniref:RNA polymerase sigma factor n=1 Tax=Candidatus Syntrophocurvum alkaliphilum TaxID=2293317 RepID=A0A6I6DLE3_9FIRM|nr:sigma-70 family RNA polymerase sigma factor [Candidatus Syntrophocurvum alkaliphilum]QGU00235.1 hypothetical protein SYNTR_1641 [Candidatus Syntrophocurvum alkaliphilum]